MLILARKENKKGQAHIFQGKYFESFQTRQLTILHRFENRNHDKS